MDLHEESCSAAYDFEEEDSPGLWEVILWLGMVALVTPAVILFGYEDEFWSHRTTLMVVGTMTASVVVFSLAMSGLVSPAALGALGVAIVLLLIFHQAIHPDPRLDNQKVKSVPPRLPVGESSKWPSGLEESLSREADNLTNFGSNL